MRKDIQELNMTNLFIFIFALSILAIIVELVLSSIVRRFYDKRTEEEKRYDNQWWG